jgi:hypothetical protein
VRDRREKSKAILAKLLTKPLVLSKEGDVKESKSDVVSGHVRDRKRAIRYFIGKVV